MENKDLSNYMKAIRNKKLNEIKMVPSERKLAIKKQNNRCKKCKKELRTYFVKYIKNPLTKEMEVICSDCAIPISKRN